jgi:hypothetical protein
MSPQLNEVLQQAETLPTDEQLQLIAHLVQNLRQIAPASPDRAQLAATQTAPQTTKIGKSIWQIAEDFVKDLPEAELAKLPTDGAAQHDHYIYGTPKLGA